MPPFLSATRSSTKPSSAEAPKHNAVVEWQYIGKTPSLNTFFGRGAWADRQRIAKKYKEQISWHIVGNYKSLKGEKFRTFSVEMECNTGYDIDNNIPMTKFFVDALVASGLIKDDNPTKYKALTMRVNKDLKKNQIILRAYLDY